MMKKSAKRTRSRSNRKATKGKRGKRTRSRSIRKATKGKRGKKSTKTPKVSKKNLQ